jgi:hypothetical protein
MAHFLQGMAAQLLLLIIFTQESDALVFGFLLFVFLLIRWAFLNKTLLTDKEDSQSAIILPLVPNSKTSLPPQSTPIKIRLGKTTLQMIRH